jgi:hypothetical protein
LASFLFFFAFVDLACQQLHTKDWEKVMDGSVSPLLPVWSSSCPSCHGFSRGFCQGHAFGPQNRAGPATQEMFIVGLSLITDPTALP